MAIRPHLEHYIPIRVTDLVGFLCKSKGPGYGQFLSEDDQNRFARVAEAASSHLHARYLSQLREMKDAYANFDPDSDTIRLASHDDERREEELKQLFAATENVLESANYIKLSKAELEKVMAGASEWGVDMDVDWDCFDRVSVFVRGKGLGQRISKPWWRLYRARTVTVKTFQRVVMILKQKAHKRLGPDADTKNVFIKMFKDIPQMDIEMLLPGTEVRMTRIDRWKLGGTIASSVFYILWRFGVLLYKAIFSALAFSISITMLVTLYSPIILILSYGYKTYASFQTTKQTYMLQLTQSLYYQNLDNNGGVLFRILDEAEEQETREVIMAYFYLWRYAGPEGWTAEQLDDYIELDLERLLNISLDFEIDDALKKLSRSGVVTKKGDRYIATPIEKALDELDDIWERYAHVSMEELEEFKTGLAASVEEVDAIAEQAGVIGESHESIDNPH